MLERRTMLAGIAAAAAVRPAGAQGLQEVVIAVSSTSFVLGGVRIGEAAGVFERDGIKPRIVVMDSGNAAMSALLGGSAQFAVSGPPELLAARARQQDVVIVANLYAGLAGFLVLSKAVAEKTGVAADAPVRARLAKLDGLVVAVPSATSSLLGPLRAAAEDAGARIRFTYMAQGAMAAALENGAVQGMMAAFPFAGGPLLRGTGVLWIDGPGAELPADVLPSSSSTLQATAAFVKANQPLVRTLQKAVADIAAFITQDPAGAKQALAKAYNQLSPQEIDLAFSRQWRSWTKPMLTVADMRQELKLLKMSTKLPGLDQIDLAAALAPPS